MFKNILKIQPQPSTCTCTLYICWPTLSDFLGISHMQTKSPIINFLTLILANFGKLFLLSVVETAELIYVLCFKRLKRRKISNLLVFFFKLASLLYPAHFMKLKKVQFHRALRLYTFITDHFELLLLRVRIKRWHVAMVTNGLWSVVEVFY